MNGHLTLSAGLTNAYVLADGPVQVRTLEFNLRIRDPLPPSGVPGAEDFLNLAMDPRHPRYYPGVVAASQLVEVTAVESNTTSPPDNRPAVVVATALTGGAPEFRISYTRTRRTVIAASRSACSRSERERSSRSWT